ncbi:hypothetical protein GALMADRAFT_162115 [Galerina marginata CBS 339.88]|uniref:FAD/NAD(P)-binding domain-containing protein n=1 Tax=Galerina marginata (strain CBS 339.88) TaxID=685588 RepID=A0A067S6B8_GALM3|nr:hypothetical protein GALMADRAFT_162115 [Galerina marginata CBS 339.88]
MPTSAGAPNANANGSSPPSPKKFGALRNRQPNHGKWESVREREREFLDPATGSRVLVIGGGQSGLEVAARLQFMDIPTLVETLERNERIRDNWRGGMIICRTSCEFPYLISYRYPFRRLTHFDPVWYDHMPYLPFPSTWPVYTPALKVLSLPLLLSSSPLTNFPLKTSQTARKLARILRLRPRTQRLDVHPHNPHHPRPTTLKWHVTLKRADGAERTFVVNHVVFCTGLGSGEPNTPEYPGMDKFKGKILHSSEHKRALDHEGKKVVVVGACTSAHDIAVDYQQHGIDVAMFQRSSTYIMSTKNGWDVIMKGAYWEDAPPVDIVDRINASFPHHMATGLKQRETKYIAELDKDLLDGLHKVGFRTNLGIKGTGFGLLAWSKAGGYYLDTGGSKLIAEGKIKLKNDSPIESFTETGIKFANGSELSADVVVFATGLGDPVGHIRRVCGDEVASRCKDIWGLNDEGELNGVWRDLGVPGLWMMLGNLALCRFHSTHIALQIKAMEEGVFGTRYEA